MFFKTSVIGGELTPSHLYILTPLTDVLRFEYLNNPVVIIKNCNIPPLRDLKIFEVGVFHVFRLTIELTPLGVVCL